MRGAAGVAGDQAVAACAARAGRLGARLEVAQQGVVREVLHQSCLGSFPGPLAEGHQVPLVRERCVVRFRVRNLPGPAGLRGCLEFLLDLAARSRCMSHCIVLHTGSGCPGVRGVCDLHKSILPQGSSADAKFAQPRYATSNWDSATIGFQCCLSHMHFQLFCAPPGTRRTPSAFGCQGVQGRCSSSCSPRTVSIKSPGSSRSPETSRPERLRSIVVLYAGCLVEGCIMQAGVQGFG